MNAWKEVTLADVCSSIDYGYTASSSVDPVGPQFLRITDIASGRVNWQEVPYCKIDDYDKNKYKLSVGDIVIARTGASTGATYTIKESDPKDLVFASYLIRYRVNKHIAFSSFIGILLSSAIWKSYVGGVIGGSAQPGANAKVLGAFSFDLPPIQEQRAIASVLSSFDDKIDLLHRENATLEKMAETLFANYFTSTSVGKRGKLNDVLDLAYGKALKEDNRSGSGYPVVGSSGIVGFHDKPLVSEPGIVIGRKGSLGNVILIDKPFWPIDTTYYIIPKRKNSIYLYEYCLLKTIEFENSDSAVPGLNRNIALNEEILIFDENIINKFETISHPLFNKISKNKNQIQTLEKLRDTLLPKLMSGEVRVQCAEDTE